MPAMAVNMANARVQPMNCLIMIPCVDCFCFGRDRGPHTRQYPQPPWRVAEKLGRPEMSCGGEDGAGARAWALVRKQPRVPHTEIGNGKKSILVNLRLCRSR